MIMLKKSCKFFIRLEFHARMGVSDLFQDRDWMHALYVYVHGGCVARLQ